MAPIIAHSQRVYLYFEGWLPEDDNKLLEFMFDRKVRAVANGLDEDFGEDFIAEAQEELEGEFNSRKDLVDIDARLKFLRRRYNIFTFVINHAGATWDPTDGYVRASDKTWRAVIRENAFAVAYYLQEEPEYDNLTTVFGTKAAAMNDLGEVEESSSIDGGASESTSRSEA